MGKWWKSQIVGGEEIPGSFEKGEILYAKNGETSIILFNGVTSATLPKIHMKNIKLLSRATGEESSYLEMQFQSLQNAEAIWHPNMIVR